MQTFRSPDALMAALALAAAAAVLPGRAGTPSSATDFSSQVRRNFAAWDQNHDGVLQSLELDAAAAKPRATGQPTAAVPALKRVSRSTRYKVPALTLRNIEQLAAQSPGAPAPSDPRDIVETTDSRGQPNLPKMFAEGLGRIANASRGEVFAAGPPPV